MAGAPLRTGKSNASRRANILAVAHGLFAKYGAAKTTIADIAREAGISVGAFYLDFASKEDVLSALSESEHDALFTAMEAAVEKSSDDLSKALFAAIGTRTRYLCKLAREATHACDLLHGCQPAVRTVRTRYTERELALFAGVIADAKTRGECGRRTPKEDARLLADAFATLLPPWLERDEAVALKRAKALVDLVVLGLRAR